MGLKQDKSNRNNPGGSNLSEDEKVEAAGDKVEQRVNPITNGGEAETVEGTEGNDSLNAGGEPDPILPGDVREDELEQGNDELVTGSEASSSDDPAAGNEEDAGPSAEHVADVADASASNQEIVDAKRTEAGAEVAALDPSAEPLPDAVDQADSSEVKQGTTESYTTGQYAGVGGSSITIDPATGQAMTKDEYLAQLSKGPAARHEELSDEERHEIENRNDGTPLPDEAE